MVDNTLITVITLVGVVFGIGWGIVGRSMDLAPKAAFRLSLANLLIATGLILIAQRDTSPSYLFYQVADWLVLAGLSFFRIGTIFLVRNELPPRWSRFVPLLLAVLATVWVEPDQSSFFVMALAFSAVAAWLAFSSFWVIYQALKGKDLALQTRIAICAPFFALGLVMVTRFALVLLVEPVVSLPTGSLGQRFTTLLWFMLLLMLLTNLALAGLAGTRLVLRIQELADRDPLTQCWNRRSLQARLKLEFDRNRRTGEDLACVFFDLDHFKAVNDVHGHEAGDAALRHTVEVVGGMLRSTDTLGRYGGEEFLVILPGTHLAGARELANRMRLALESRNLTFHGKDLALTASFGVAVLGSKESQDALIQRADKAMYDAKRNGRNRVEVT